MERDIPEPLTVADLRSVLDGLPGDMPVALSDDGSFDPLRWAKVRQWKWDQGWGVLEHDPEPDDEPDSHVGFTTAVVLTADYEP